MRFALFAVCLVLASCTGKEPAETTQEPRSAESRHIAGIAGSKTPSAPEKAARPDTWETRDNTAKSGDFEVTITQTGVELIHVEGVQDRTDVFVVRVSINNTSPSKRHQYTTWAGNASLSDNFGNSYQRLPRPRNLGVREVPLDPTEPVVDALIFEAPIKTAGHVNLHLPGGNLGLSDGFNFRIVLHTSGERLNAVTRAAAANEAEARAKAAGIAAKEAAAQRAEAQRREEYRLAEENARARQQEAALAEEKARAAAEKLRQEAEIKALPGKLASAQSNLVDAKDKMRAIKASSSSYTWSGARMPDDYFTGRPRKYVYYGKSQRITRTKEVQDEIERLTAEIAALEARIKSSEKKE
jgi:hypothetical protein